MTTTAAWSRHRLAARAHAAAADRLVFHWLPAAYAHAGWLGDALPQRAASRRALCRASAVLLQRHGLATRHAADLQQREWLLLPDDRLHAAATELGAAMLGGWVRNGLQREEVARQRRVLSPELRSRALAHAGRLHALPFPRLPWPLPADDGAAVQSLGVSCMAALLAQPDDGAAQRLALRFAPGTVQPLALDEAQRQEALALLAALVRDWNVAPGWLDSLQWGAAA